MADWIFWITWNIPIYFLLVCLSLFWHNRSPCWFVTPYSGTASIGNLCGEYTRALTSPWPVPCIFVCLPLFWHNRSPSFHVLSHLVSSFHLHLALLSFFALCIWYIISLHRISSAPCSVFFFGCSLSLLSYLFWWHFTYILLVCSICFPTQSISSSTHSNLIQPNLQQICNNSATTLTHTQSLLFNASILI